MPAYNWLFIGDVVPETPGSPHLLHLLAKSLIPALSVGLHQDGLHSIKFGLIKCLFMKKNYNYKILMTSLWCILHCKVMINLTKQIFFCKGCKESIHSLVITLLFKVSHSCKQCGTNLEWIFRNEVIMVEKKTRGERWVG